jgi:hypothetical protein
MIRKSYFQNIFNYPIENMGVDNIYMGKGIVVPVNLFVAKYREEVEKIYKEKGQGYELETIQEVVKKYIGDYDVCTMGHDAFEGGCLEMFEDSRSEESASRIQELIGEGKEYKGEHLPFDSVHCTSLIFIGHFVNICNNELSSHPAASEVIYSMAACIPSIVKHYPLLLAKDCSSLNNVFDQEACVWTFAPDCCCCG